MRKVNRNTMGKFFKLSNGQYMKILFSYKKLINSWFMSICVADTKRMCNDCLNKTENSPKILYGKITGKKLGLEPLLIAKKWIARAWKSYIEYRDKNNWGFW